MLFSISRDYMGSPIAFRATGPKATLMLRSFIVMSGGIIGKSLAGTGYTDTRCLRRYDPKLGCDRDCVLVRCEVSGLETIPVFVEESPRVSYEEAYAAAISKAIDSARNIGYYTVYDPRFTPYYYTDAESTPRNRKATGLDAGIPAPGVYEGRSEPVVSDDHGNVQPLSEVKGSLANKGLHTIHDGGKVRPVACCPAVWLHPSVTRADLDIAAEARSEPGPSMAKDMAKGLFGGVTHAMVTAPVREAAALNQQAISARISQARRQSDRVAPRPVRR